MQIISVISRHSILVQLKFQFSKWRNCYYLNRWVSRLPPWFVSHRDLIFPGRLWYNFQRWSLAWTLDLSLKERNIFEWNNSWLVTIQSFCGFTDIELKCKTRLFSLLQIFHLYVPTYWLPLPLTWPTSRCIVRLRLKSAFFRLEGGPSRPLRPGYFILEDFLKSLKMG